MWNYRVIRRVCGEEVTYSIHETYYGTGHGGPGAVAHTEDAQAVDVAFSKDEDNEAVALRELRTILAMMELALHKPVLDYMELDP